VKNRLTTYDSNNVDERLPYKLFSIEVKKLNNEHLLMTFFLEKKNAHHILDAFSSLKCNTNKNKVNIHINVHHSKHVRILHMRNT
jgi:adenylyl- and sulfurtransferase ThiI